MHNIDINLTPTATLLEIDAYKKIPCRSWGIASESNAAFLLIHGLGGHSGWFEPLARRLKVKNIFGLALDLAGFGKRKNDKDIHLVNWLKDIETAAQYLRSVMSGKPIFLLGNSMGGLVALKACQQIKPDGLILLSPAFGGHPKLFTVSYQIRELFNALVKPDRQVILPYGTKLITKNEQAKLWIDNDEDRRLAVPSNMLLKLLITTQTLHFKGIGLDCPLFMITAGMDEIVNNKTSELIFKRIGAPKKKKTTMPHSMHDLTLDAAIDQVAEMLTDWAYSIVKENEKPSMTNKQRAR